MANVAVYDMDGNTVGEIDLADGIFAVAVNEHAVHAAVVQFLANQRQGTKSAKTRAEVSGGGRKPWRQKGTGRARQGSRRAPQWKGGGVVFAPKPRDFSVKLNKKLKRLALKSVLSAKVAENKLIVLDRLAFDEIKTKNMVKVVDNLKIGGKAMFVTETANEFVVKSARNLPGVKTAAVNTINVYDILNADAFVVTKDAVCKMQEVYA